MDNKLRILYLQTFPLYGSGSGTYARYLAREVSRHHQVAMVTPDHRRLTNSNVKMYPIKMPFNVSFTGHPEWKNGRLYKDISHREILTIYKSFLNHTVDAVEDFRPNIIHVHHAFPFSWAARFVKSTYQIPYIITVHGSELPTAQKDKRYLALTMDALRRARRIIPNSFYTKEWLFKVFGDDYRRRVRVIPGGVDINKFRKVATDDIDKQFNIAGEKIVVFAGKLTVYKGVKYLVRAAKKIRGKVFILGDGPERKNLEKMVKDEKVSNVKFLGHFGDDTDFLIKFYSRANVFVAPSVWDEPLGLVILEAMACETPVVVTRKGGIPLAVKDGQNGFFIKPRNSQDMAEKINILFDNEPLRLKMAKRAREIAVKKFSWEMIAHRFENIYQKFAYFNHTK
ncbi:glycosyltransferase family 4 protein [Candidatus Roizmanbacteria bacterium]|nr:glycosyltransferase family 4 protein [Candidatus Roizmanbacteria bacterium]